MGIGEGPGATGDMKDHSPPFPAASSLSDEGEVVQRTYGFPEGDLKRVAEVKEPLPPDSCLKGKKVSE
jgi:hypothetical protein